MITGEGWANPPPTAMTALFKASHILSSNFPERVEQIIVFPLPWYAKAAYNLVYPFLDANMAAKIIVLAGECDFNSPDPEELKEYSDISSKDVQFLPWYDEEKDESEGKAGSADA